MKRFTAAAVAAALIIAAPGPSCWQAVAQTSVAAAGAFNGFVSGQVSVAAVDIQVPNGAQALPWRALGGSGSGSLSLSVANPANGIVSGPIGSVEIHAPVARGKMISLLPIQGGASTAELLAQPELVSRSAQEIASMSAGDAESTGRAIMDIVLRTRSIRGPGLGVELVAVEKLIEHPSGLELSRERPEFAPAAPATPAGSGDPRGSRSVFSKAKGFVFSVAVTAAGAGAVLGLQKLGMLFLPAIFGVVPVAAVWAVGSGVFILPAALYARYRLGLRGSPRLKGVKLMLDLVTGAYLGALAIALPGIFSGAVSASLGTLGLGAAAGLAGAAALPKAVGEGTSAFNSLLTYGALILPALLVFPAALAAPITLGAVLGMMALPAMATVAFFLGRVISSVESGRPFSIPGLLQPIRFPSFTWVMTGVVFALLTGFAPWHSTIAFIVWQLLGDRAAARASAYDLLQGLASRGIRSARVALGLGGALAKVLKYLSFDNIFLGALAYSAVTGFSAPATFLVLAFAPERAAVWAERWLGRLLPGGEPAPSSGKPNRSVEDGDRPAQWPRLRLWARTFFFMGNLVGLGFAMGATVFGWSALLTNTAIAGALAFIPFWFGTRIVKFVMKAEPTDEAKDPELFAAMGDLRGRINAKRAAQGKKPIPMPEIVNVPMPVPNAFATGRGPFHALVGVTAEFKRMILGVEKLRSGLMRLLASVDPQGSPFKAFRIAIAGSVPGIAADADPAQVAAAVRAASREQLQALGERVLRSVLAHEFSHVMNRDMLIGMVGGAVSSGIAFASYGVMWALGRAKAVARGLWDRARGRSAPAALIQNGTGEPGVREEGTRPEVVEPVSIGIALKTVAGLLKVFAALWGPIIAQILQMTVSRQRESHADESGAILSEDPEALALGLGLLTAWRPADGYRIDLRRLPIVAATSHLFTVNPVQQMEAAGLLGARAAASQGRPVERADDWISNLFITHPDTGQRIERLYRMALANRSSTRPGKT